MMLSRERLARITPAYAGRRSSSGIHLTASRDHPRVRGEKGTERSITYPAMGSPPRTRGEEVPLSCLGDLDGITPAYAGRRATRITSPLPQWDHPRVRGEKLVTLVSGLDDKGSPPRTRGEGEQPRKQGAKKRITPAYAGRS